MARKNPLGTIKDVAVGTAKGGVELGLSVAGQVASKATDTVTSLIPGRKESTAPTPDLEPAVPAAASRKSQGDALAPVKTAATQKPAAQKPAAKKAPAKASTAKKAAPQVEVSSDKPVNVTKELGLDPAPVAEPAPAATPEPKPVTKIDAAADASAVDVTPADIAPAKKAPVKKTAAKKAPAKKAASKTAPAKKSPDSSPGDKLPPRTS